MQRELIIRHFKYKTLAITEFHYHNYLTSNVGVKLQPPGWWSNNTYVEFNIRAKCVEDQYSKLVIEELPINNEDNKKPTINGSQTLAENIADLGGNRLAYYAYRK